jgi:hypothetical protein
MRGELHEDKTVSKITNIIKMKGEHHEKQTRTEVK